MPVLWVALPVKAGNDQNPILLYVNEDSVGKPPPCACLLELADRLRQPNDGKSHNFLKQLPPDLLPADDIGGVFPMPFDAAIQLPPLSARERCHVRFQAFSDHIQQFRFLSRREAFDLTSQVSHCI